MTTPGQDDADRLDPEDAAIATRLVAERPAAPPHVRSRVRSAIGRALGERVLRRRSAVLLGVGWATLASAVVLAVA